MVLLAKKVESWKKREERGAVDERTNERKKQSLAGSSLGGKGRRLKYVSVFF